MEETQNGSIEYEEVEEEIEEIEEIEEEEGEGAGTETVGGQGTTMAAHKVDSSNEETKEASSDSGSTGLVSSISRVPSSVRLVNSTSSRGRILNNGKQM